MKRKDYQKPTMRVVELQQRTMLLAGSVVDATRGDYGNANEDVTETLTTDGEWVWE